MNQNFYLVEDYFEPKKEKLSNEPNDANEDNVFSDSSLGRIDVKT